MLHLLAIQKPYEVSTMIGLLDLLVIFITTAYFMPAVYQILLQAAFLVGCLVLNMLLLLLTILVRALLTSLWVLIMLLVGASAVAILVSMVALILPFLLIQLLPSKLGQITVDWCHILM